MRAQRTRAGFESMATNRHPYRDTRHGNNASPRIT
jgi:hypothetical protein